MGHQWTPEQPAVDDRHLRPPAGRERPESAVLPAAIGAARQIDAGSRAQLFSSLQRTVGNAAVISAGRWASPAVAVQRCGDIPPESCPCHDDAKTGETDTAGPQSAAADHSAPLAG